MPTIRSKEKQKKERKIWDNVKPHSTPIFQTSVYDYPDLESLDDFYEGRIPDGFLYSRNGLPNSKESDS